MFLQIARPRIACVALVAGLASAQSVLAAEPVRITYHGVAGAPIVCDSDTTPAIYDVGAPPEGASEKTLPFAVGNNSDGQVTDLLITITGSQVPGIFWQSYTNNRGTIYPNSGVSFNLKFRPPAGDPSGTTYGGDASKVLVRVTYKIKPKKGKAVTGTPLELVLKAQKR